MTERATNLAGAVDPARLAAAQQESAAFTEFCGTYSLDLSAEAVALYLTSLLVHGLHGRQIRERLQRLDLIRRIEGKRPWSTNPEVRTFLRGLFAHRPVGERSGHYDPLYIELVQAMVDACRAPTPDQVRAAAAQAVQHASGATVTSIARMEWRDVKIHKSAVDVGISAKVGRGPQSTTFFRLGDTCGDKNAVALFRALRTLGGGIYVFGADGAPFHADRLRALLKQPSPGSPAPAQVRDAALLLIGYSAGLRTLETQILRQADIEPHDRGLVLTIQGRERKTHVPSAANPAYDAATAWNAWIAMLDEHGRGAAAGLAFPATNFSVIFEKALLPSGLNGIVHRRAEEAGLQGRFVWTSLRTGMMRTAIRNDVRAYTIAAHADLVSLGSVQRHERRETLLGDGNVASLLGL